MPKSAQPRLPEVQRQMLDTIRRPLMRGEKMQPIGAETAEKFIIPNDRLTSFERLEIYNQQYWWRLHGAFADDFPGVSAVVGPRNFDRLTVAYLEACPSRSWTLRNLGSRLPQFLVEHPEITAPHTALACDVARVEWAATAAFDDAEIARIDPQQLASTDPSTLRLTLQPYLHLLELRHPVDRLLAKLRKRSGDTAASSNAVGEHKSRRAVRLSARALREPLYLAVHRVDFSVFFKRLTPVAYRLLLALKAGEALASACESALSDFTDSSDEATAQVRDAFAMFTSLGWLCQTPATRSKKARG